MKTKHVLLSVWVAVVFALHQDIWNWTKGSPLLFGMLPPGLTYHLCYSVLAAITMALLVKYAWPEGLDEDKQEPKTPPDKDAP